MKRNNTITLLTTIMLLSLATAFITTDVFIGELLSSLSIITGAFCSGQLLKQQQS